MVAEPSHRYADGYVVDVPYLPGFYPALAPERLAAAALFNGVVPPAVDEPFSYLELGCGLGDTLLTLAAANPHGLFTGVDINPDHAAAMRARASRCGLTNVRVCECGFDGLPADLPPQQFITMHGVFSWVSERTRDQIVAIARSHLARGGLLLASYNALPGWAPLLAVRRLIRELAESATGDSCQRVQAAIAMAREMQAAGAPIFAHNPQAATLLADLGNEDPRYLAHEFLNDNWTAFSVADVAGRFAAAGLGYVGSLPLADNLPAIRPGPALLRFLPPGDRIAVETRCDLLTNQSFRWDIFGRAPEPIVDAAHRLAVSGSGGVRLSDPDTTLPWSAQVAGRDVVVEGAPHDTIVALLRDRPRRLDELVAELAAATPALEHGQILDEIDFVVALGLLRIDARRLPPPPIAPRPPFDVPLPFNRDALRGLGPGVKHVALASAATGTGYWLKVLDGIVLAALADAPASDPTSAGFARAVDERFRDRGPPLVRRSTGEPLASGAERTDAVAAVCRDFVRLRLPELVQLGIVTAR